MKYSLLIAAFLTATAALGAFADRAIAADPIPEKQPGQIQTTGNGRVERTPDYVDIIAGIEAQAKTAAAAQEQAGSIMRKTLEAIDDLSLKDEDLKSGTISLSPRYEMHNSKTLGTDEQRIVGYTAMITVRIRTSDLEATASVIDAALAAGANRIDSVEFGLKEAIEAREEAIALATKAAKRKATVIANALDIKLGRLLNASASEYRPYPMAKLSNSFRGAEDGGATENAIVPGKIEITADVSLTFAVAD